MTSFLHETGGSCAFKGAGQMKDTTLRCWVKRAMYGASQTGSDQQ